MLFKILIVATLLYTACKTTKQVNSCIGQSKPNSICTMDYKPVCGCDGKRTAMPVGLHAPV